MGWFQTVFSNAHCKVQETTDINNHDAVMHHANTVRGMVAGIQEVLQQKPVPFEVPFVIQEPQIAHEENAVQDNQQQLAYHIQ